MKHLICRINTFLFRLQWVSQLMGTQVKAFNYLVRSRKNLKLLGHGSYKDLAFSFCGYDLSALKEVLIDQEYNFLKTIIEDKDTPVILDIGAHIGTFAIWCYGVNTNCQITSVEADPITFKTLQNNIALNIRKDLNWICVNKAAWKNSDSLSFSNKGDSMSHKVSNDGKIIVQGVPLNELLQDDGMKIDILKIDIEGAEEAFICENPTLLKKIKHLVVELHPNLCDSDRVYNVLKKSYTNVEDIGNRTSSKPLLFCSNPV